MTLVEIVSFITLVLKVGLIIFNKVKSVPSEQRAAELAKFDAAMSKADAGDLGDLSKWIGGHL